MQFQTEVSGPPLTDVPPASWVVRSPAGTAITPGPSLEKEPFVTKSGLTNAAVPTWKKRGPVAGSGLSGCVKSSPGPKVRDVAPVASTLKVRVTRE